MELNSILRILCLILCCLYTIVGWIEKDENIANHNKTKAQIFLAASLILSANNN